MWHRASINTHTWVPDALKLKLKRPPKVLVGCTEILNKQFLFYKKLCKRSQYSSCIHSFTKCRRSLHGWKEWVREGKMTTSLLLIHHQRASLQHHSRKNHVVAMIARKKSSNGFTSTMKQTQWSVGVVKQRRLHRTEILKNAMPLQTDQETFKNQD